MVFGQPLHRKGLGPEIVGSLFDCLHCVVQLGLTSEDDYRDRRIQALRGIRGNRESGLVLPFKMQEDKVRDIPF